MTIFGTAMSCQAKENVCDAQSIPVRLHCPFENCHKSYNCKKHINEHFLSTAKDRHVLNSKTTPQAARGCGIRDTVKIFGQGLFMTSPDHLGKFTARSRLALGQLLLPNQFQKQLDCSPLIGQKKFFLANQRRGAAG